MMGQEGSGKALAALKNLTAERYWETRWQREWETKYHDPLVVRPGSNSDSIRSMMATKDMEVCQQPC